MKHLSQIGPEARAEIETEIMRIQSVWSKEPNVSVRDLTAGRIRALEWTLRQDAK